MALPAYMPSDLPIIDGGLPVYMQREAQRLKVLLDAYLMMIPQAAQKAPAQLIDGMRRLSRNPWRPVVGQVADAWVYYDAAGALWRYDATAPTNT